MFQYLQFAARKQRQVAVGWQLSLKQFVYTFADIPVPVHYLCDSFQDLIGIRTFQDVSMDSCSQGLVDHMPLLNRCDCQYF